MPLETAERLIPEIGIELPHAGGRVFLPFSYLNMMAVQTPELGDHFPATAEESAALIAAGWATPADHGLTVTAKFHDEVLPELHKRLNGRPPVA